MNKKPVLYRDVKEPLTLNAKGFHEKLLCDGIIFNLGDACAYSCEFCYVEESMFRFVAPIIRASTHTDGQLGSKVDALRFQDVVIRRRGAVQRINARLVRPDGSLRFNDPEDTRVVYSSTLVDVAANMELLRETAEACNAILDQTHWQIRLLSKSNILHKLVEDGLIPERHHRRLIFGFSTGTLDDRVAKAIESGTPLVSKRIKTLHWLQDRGFRTFGMICPSLPQEDQSGYERASREICEAIRVEKCEHVWAEVINFRGKSFPRTLEGLRREGLSDEANRVETISDDSSKSWEDYARATFEAHVKHVPADKLRFLQYITEGSSSWWAAQRDKGAVLLGKVAVNKKLTAILPKRKRAISARTALSAEDRKYRTSREKIVGLGVRASIRAAKALYEIFSYRGGALWKASHDSFESYCREKWDYGKAHSYRLKDCGDFVVDLEKQSPIGDLPANEGQVRPILDLPRESRIRVWKAVVKDVGPEARTAVTIASKTREHAKRLGVPTGAVEKRILSDKERAAAALSRFKAIIVGMPEANAAEALLGQLSRLLGMD